MDDLASLFNDSESDLGRNIPQSQLQDIMQRLQLSGMVSRQHGDNSNLNVTQGRVGYNFPLGENNLNVGLSGLGVNGQSNGYRFGNRGLIGGDISYGNGDSDLSLRYDTIGGMPQTMQTNSPSDIMQQQSPQNQALQRNLLQLLYRKSF